MGCAGESVLAAVSAALDAFESGGLGDLPCWPEGALRAAVVDAERLGSRLRGLQSRLVAEVNRRDLAGRDGCASPAAWLSHHLGVSGGEAARRLDEAAAVAGSPEVAAALERGEITPEHARTIGSTLRAEPTMSATELVEHARLCDAGRFAGRAARLRRAHQGDGGLSQFEAQRQARRCSVTVRADDGMVVVRAELDPLDGARVRAKLLAQAERLWRVDHPSTASGPPPAGPVAQRTNAQRMADALVELCAQPPTALGAGAEPACPGPLAEGAPTGRGVQIGRSRGGAPPPRPSEVARTAAPVEVEVLVTIDLATLVGDRAGSAEVLGVGPIPAATARRLACQAGLIPVVLGAAGETLDLGRSRRLANRAQRRALRRHHHHCAWDGCTTAFEWCQIHHIRPWTNGGRTDLANLIPLCHAHHHLVHEGGWTIRPAPGTELAFHPPRQHPDEPATATATATDPRLEPPRDAP